MSVEVRSFNQCSYALKNLTPCLLQRLLEEVDSAGVRPYERQEYSDRSAFSGAVWTKESIDVSTIDSKAESVECDDMAESFPQILYDDHRSRFLRQLIQPVCF